MDIKKKETTEEELLEGIIGYDALYASMMKCKRGVLWKDSVAHYYLNSIEETLKLEEQLKNGTYKPRKPKKIIITHPKRREAVGIAFRDRVYQRSLNDNVLYPVMTKSFIAQNAACQKDKGTDFARDILCKYLRKFFRQHGTDGGVLQCDIKEYYRSMDHEKVEGHTESKLRPEIFKRARDVLRQQYEGDVGYNPGSQMVQIIGISILDALDHFIKEELHIKYYVRYMDDFILMHESEEYLQYCEQRIAEFLGKMKFQLHPNKTKIYALKKGIMFLGFTHRLTDTGKVVKTIDSDNVRDERRKLRRMVHLVMKGEMTKKKVNKCYESWRNHALKGDSTKLVMRMDKYYKDLWKERW